MATVPDLSGNNSTTDATVVSDFPYPSGATPITATSGNVANANAVATLAGVEGKTTYVTGISLTGSGASGGAVVLATLAGLVSGTQSFVYVAASGASTGNAPLNLAFDPPIPASAPNTAIVLTLPALGSGNTNAVANITGFQI